MLAHNLVRWTAILGDIRANDELTVTRTTRTRLLTIPGRLVNHAGRTILRMPQRWPWKTTFTNALTQLRALNFAPG